MVELYSLDDVGQGFDMAQNLEVPARYDNRSPHQRFHDLLLFAHAFGLHGRVRLGRPMHRSGKLGAGEMTSGGSLWGHERLWLDAERRQSAREIQLRAAAAGLRQPVQVLEGNYAVSAGVCPWWDQAKKRAEQRTLSPIVTPSPKAAAVIRSTSLPVPPDRVFAMRRQMGIHRASPCCGGRP